MHEINFVIFIQVFTITVLAIISALKIDVLDMPSSVLSGESIELTCMYSLENDRLYSIKWYKNGYEFYRYVPKEFPPAQNLAMPNSGIKLDLSKSNAQKVYLQNVNLSTGGKYRCEISAEAPSFNTAAKEAYLEINVLPSEGPRIDTGGMTRFRPGDEITANCTSAKSKPPAKLNFTINDEIVGRNQKTQYSTELHDDGLQTTEMSVKFKTSTNNNNNFNSNNNYNGNLKLKCTATILNLYEMNDEVILINEEQYPSSGLPNSQMSQVHTSKSEAKDIHNSDSPKEWKVLSVLFAMYFHRQLQRVFVT